MRKLAVLLLLAAGAWAQVPTATNLNSFISDDHPNQITIRWNVTNAYCWVGYSDDPAVPFKWTSRDSYSEQDSSNLHTCSLPIDDLDDGTTYYFQPTARPNAANETNICAASGCGLGPLTLATPAASVAHFPIVATAVSSTLTTEPSTTGYAIVDLSPVGTGAVGECASVNTVNAPSGYTGSIPAGTLLSYILNNPAHNMLWYGTVFQAAEGVECHIPLHVDPDGTQYNTAMGYALYPLAVDPNATAPYCVAASSDLHDACNHRWIIFRTTPTTAANFPPTGFRTAPNFFSHYALFKQMNPCVASGTYGSGAGCNSASPTYDGFIFHARNQDGTNIVHHWLIENLSFAVDDTQTTAQWGSFMQWGNGEGGGTSPFPKYMIARGNYFKAPTKILANCPTGASIGVSNADCTPFARATIMGTWQGQIAIVGNYTINALNYGAAHLYTNFYVEDCAGGTCNTGGPVLISNNYIEGMDMALIVESNNWESPTVVHDFTVSRNASIWFSGSGSPHAGDTKAWAIAQKLNNAYACRDHLEFKGGQRMTIYGNWLSGAWNCADGGFASQVLSTGPSSDFLYRSNLITNVVSPFTSANQANALQASNSMYGAGDKIAYINNLVYNLGLGTRYAGGPAANSPLWSSGTGFTNVTWKQNTIVGPAVGGDATFQYAGNPLVFQSSGGDAGNLVNFDVENNIFPYGQGGGVNASGVYVQHGLGGNGAASHPKTPYSYDAGNFGNTHTFNFTTILRSYAGIAKNTAGLGMQGVSIISGGTGYPASGALTFTNCSSSPVGTFAASGGVIISSILSDFGAGCNPATMTVAASTSGGGSGASLRPHYGLTPQYTWHGNVITPTNVAHDYGAIVELADSDLTAYTATAPAGDVWLNAAPYLAGCANTQQTGCINAHILATGMGNYLNNDFRCTPTLQHSCHAGANLALLASDLGIVSGVSQQVGVTSASLQYLSPDAAACSADISSDSGAHWTRSTDAGGARNRSIYFSGLTASTSYQYRLLCVFDQSEGATEGWFSFPSDPSNLATDGTFTTLAAGTRSPSFAFALSDFAGTDHYKVTMTATDGVTTYTNTCTASPCVVASVPAGDYSTLREYLTGTAVIVPGVLQTISVR